MGTRFLPFTKAMPKEMIPIVDTPTLQYIVKEVVDSGITDILIINNSQKTAIERHFSSANEEVELLLSRGKEREAKIISEISNLANISFVHQEFPSGSAGAVMLAKEFVNGEPFALLFGDDLIDSKVPAVKQLMDAYDKYGKTVLGVQPVLKENISKYGSISIVKQEGKVYFIDDVIEKPKTEEAPSLIAALGRYIVSPEVFDYIDKTPTVKHEVGITDTPFKNVDIDCFGYTSDDVITQQILYLKSSVKNISDVHEEKNEDSGLDTGKGNVPHLAETTGTVQSCSFVKLRVDGGDCSKINDAVPTGFFPYITETYDPPEEVLLSEEVHWLIDDTEFLANFIDDTAVHGEHIADDTGYDDPGQEVRQIRNCLNKFLGCLESDFVKKQSKANSKSKAKDKIDNTHHEGISDVLNKHFVAEELFEVF